MEYFFRPFEGVNNVKFGMTQSEVETITDKATEIIENPILNEINEIRNCVSYVYRNGKLIEFKFGEDFNYNQNSIIFSGMVLCNDLETIEKLSMNPENKISDIVRGVVVFHGIGACFSGFKKMKLNIEKEICFYSKDRLRFYEIRVDKNKL